MKRWGKSPPAIVATRSARQTPSGARRSRSRRRGPPRDRVRRKERWSSSTESGLQACYGKSPGNGAFSMKPDSPATRQAHPAAGLTAVSVEPLGAVARPFAFARSQGERSSRWGGSTCLCSSRGFTRLGARGCRSPERPAVPRRSLPIASAARKSVERKGHAPRASAVCPVLGFDASSYPRDLDSRQWARVFTFARNP